MYSELLLSRQGPLAHVWLASNYDKKLSKQQLLSTNIVSSSNFISNHPIQPSRNVPSTTTETITLRLSGQLLLGIVRIYSRKTKYLLDDIHETLFKLKNSFKYASGATLGNSAVSSVNLPPLQTTISNFSRILLQDQVTDLDLFYQEDLNLDDEPSRGPGLLFGQVSSVDATEDVDFDRSIEFPRRVTHEEDVDLELDFDLDMDASIEQGRDAQTPMAEADDSILDVAKDAPSYDYDDFNAEFDLGQPLETIEEQPPSDGPEEPQTPPSEPRRPVRRLVGVTEGGVIRTTKRKLVVDSADELERGLPNDVLRNIQHLQTYGRFAEETLTLKLTETEKLQLIDELAAPVGAKRRKIWNLDDLLTLRCVELSNEQEQNVDQQMDYDYDYDNNLDFDLSLPEIETEEIVEHVPEVPEEIEEGNISNIKATIQVAQHLRNTFNEEPTSTLDGLVKKDLLDDTNIPLGTIQKTSSSVKVSQRREATKCFFELLVLATHDCVSLEQEQSSATLMGENIVIRPRDNLTSRFL